MVQMGTVLDVMDNSGARTVRCIKVLNTLQRTYGCNGDVCVVSVQKINPLKKIKKGSVYHCLVARSKARDIRKQGEIVKFGSNSGILINSKGGPLGTRVLGAVSAKLRKKKYMKIVSIAKVTI